MKGERTLVEKPFRYGGFFHNYDLDVEEWQAQLKMKWKCCVCRGEMRNCYSPAGTLLKRTYPYVGRFKITKGKNRGLFQFRVMCRSCTYTFGRGVIEMNAETYRDMDEFNEERYKKEQWHRERHY